MAPNTLAANPSPLNLSAPKCGPTSHKAKSQLSHMSELHQLVNMACFNCRVTVTQLPSKDSYVCSLFYSPLGYWSFHALHSKFTSSSLDWVLLEWLDESTFYPLPLCYPCSFGLCWYISFYYESSIDSNTCFITIFSQRPHLDVSSDFTNAKLDIEFFTRWFSCKVCHIRFRFRFGYLISRDIRDILEIYQHFP